MNEMPVLFDKLYDIHQSRSVMKERPTKQNPDFGIFDFFGLGEVTLSNIFRWLLDPNETHLQGNIFLKKFFEIVADKSIEKLMFQTFKFEKVKVEAETFTEENRRIDLVISSTNFLIGIENKVWAEDQINQVSHYLDTLEKRRFGRNYCLIYLSPKGSDPNHRSISKERLVTIHKNTKFNGSLQLWSYQKDVILWLNRCLQLDCPKTVLEFIEKLIKQINKDILEEVDMKHLDQIVNLIDQNEKYISSAMTIISNQNGIRELLWRKFIRRLYAKVNCDPKSSWISYEPDGSNSTEIWLQDLENSERCPFKVGFSFFFIKADAFSGLSFAIWYEKKDERNLELISKLKDKLKREGLSKKYDEAEAKKRNLLSHTQFNSKERVFFGHNWAGLIEPWVEMADGGKMENKVLECANEASETLKMILES